jgi:hypothetical protein
VTSDLNGSLFKDAVPTLRGIKHGSFRKSYQLMCREISAAHSDNYKNIQTPSVDKVKEV